MTYCWKCTECGYRFDRPMREPTTPDPCPNCAADTLVRDWKAEGVGVDRFALKTWGSRAQRREPEGDGKVTFA